MTDQEGFELRQKLRATEETAHAQAKQLRRIKHLVHTYWDVCTTENDPHAAKIMLAINQVLEGQ